MPSSLAPIPLGAQIVDTAGSITDFFRLRWQSLIDGFQLSATVADVQKLAQTAALVATAAFTTKAAAAYRITYYLRKTVADGVASSATVTLGWTETGVALTVSGAALVLDTVLAVQTGSALVWADGATDITYAVAYSSTTPNKMTYRLDVTVEQLA